jgi:hypothetical protein
VFHLKPVACQITDNGLGQFHDRKSSAKMSHTQQPELSLPTYLVLIATLVIAVVLNPFLPQGTPVSDQALPGPNWLVALTAAGISLVIYGGLGFVGLKLAQKLSFAGLWEPTVTNRQRFLLPAVIGAGLGLFFILVDTLFSGWHGLGPLPHPPFPTSILASIAAGIGEELIFRLFFISFWVWLVSAWLLKGKWQQPIFWVFAVLSAPAFALAHLPSVMAVMDFESLQAIPPLLAVELLVLNGLLSLFAAYYFRIYGFLAAVGIHFWTDVVWHVIWGMLS